MAKISRSDSSAGDVSVSVGSETYDLSDAAPELETDNAAFIAHAELSPVLSVDADEPVAAPEPPQYNYEGVTE